MMKSNKLSFSKQATGLLLATSLLSGCAGLTEEQRAAGIGAAIGTVVGAAVIGGTAGSDKAARQGAVIGAGVGALGAYVWSKQMQEQKRKLEQATEGTGVDVVQTVDNRLKLEVPSDISFDLNRANIKANFQPILDRFANSLIDHQSTEVSIVGHTDDSGNDNINDPLSVNRASSTRQYLASRGVAIRRISIDGRGSREPIADNRSVQGRSQNRRVEIYIAEPAPAYPQSAPATNRRR